MSAHHFILHLDFVQGKEERFATVEQRRGHCFGVGMTQPGLFENPTSGRRGHARSDPRILDGAWRALAEMSIIEYRIGAHKTWRGTKLLVCALVRPQARLAPLYGATDCL